MDKKDFMNAFYRILLYTIGLAFVALFLFIMTLICKGTGEGVMMGLFILSAAVTLFIIKGDKQ